MRWERVINKVKITDEAVVDYETLCLSADMPKADIKQQTETYIDNLQTIGRLRYDYYFRCKYFDEQTNQMLMLFFYKGRAFGKMQIWKLAGLCVADDWTAELEDSGQIRFWLNSKVVDLDKTDWVIKFREWQEQERKERERGYE